MEPVNFKNPNHEPQWLQDLRKVHWNHYTNASWDDLDVESWRYLKPKDVLKDFHTSYTTKTKNVLPELTNNLGDGIRVVSFQEAQQDDIAQLNHILALPRKYGVADRFGDLHMAVFDSALFLDVAPGASFEKPATLTTKPSSESGVTLIVVRVGEKADVSILDDLHGTDSGHVRLLCLLEAGAKVTFVSAQNVDESANTFQHHHFFLSQDANLETTYLPIGSKQNRIEQWVSFIGRGAQAKTNGLIFAHKQQLFDFESTQNHFLGHTNSELFFRNVVTDKAKSIFIGNVFIDKKASGTVANQTNKNLLLSPDAEVVTTPKLEIDTEDVQCGHGATVATLSEDEIYYLQSRGLKRHEAMKMVIGGFLAEILDRIPEGHLRDHVAKTLERRVQEVVL